MRWLLAMAAVGALGCEGEPHTLEWRFRFETDVLRDRGRFVEARIVRGGCAEGGTEIWVSSFAVGSRAASGPPALDPGRYGISGRARDGECRWYARGCAEVVLPVDQAEIVVPLAAAPEEFACGDRRCVGGICEGEDAGPPPDPDAGPGDGGMPRDVGPNDAGPPPDAPPMIIVPDDPGPGMVRVDIDTTAERRAISPWIYGLDQPSWTEMGDRITIGRESYSRISTYNWENNASNGSAYFSWSNDGHYAGGDVAGAAFWNRIEAARTNGGTFVVPIPLLGHVAADKLGPVDTSSPSFLSTRFRQSLPRKGSPFAYPPSVSDSYVYQDEFASWLETSFPTMSLVYALDNVPDDWEDAYPAIHPARVTYAEIRSQTVEYADAIKDVAPDAVVIAPVVGGWQALRTLNGAGDAATHGAFFEWYLSEMAAAEASEGHRLLDAFALVWDSEARSTDGIRVNGTSSTATVTAARVQASRSLWDDTFVESSWITTAIDEPIRLLPRLRETIAARYPGTGIALTSWSFGGGSDVSGAIVAADVLGICGRQGVIVATMKNPSSGTDAFPLGAFAMYRAFDPGGVRFGETSVRAVSTDDARATVHASVDGDRVVFVAINRDTSALDVAVAITHHRLLTRLRAWQLTSASPDPAAIADPSLSLRNAFHLDLPARSVTTVVAE